MSRPQGIVASGHAETSAAAAEVLSAGGNAFDAALAGLCAAFMAEPMLTSLGGGGFLMAQCADGERILHDFFVQTPAARRPADDIDFYPVAVDFGTAVQEFHVGRGAMAVPGVVAGLFAVHRRHGRMPMADIMAPAIALARQGVLINELQHGISRILAPILSRTPDAMRLVATDDRPAEIAAPGSRVSNPALAGVLEALALEGPDLFYRGELAHRLAADCREGGGLLTRDDLAGYRSIERRPLEVPAFGAACAFNPPPTPGGGLLAFALSLLEGTDIAAAGWGSAEYARSLALAMQATGRARALPGFDEDPAARLQQLLSPESLAQWREGLARENQFTRGTTHISVADAEGNLAALTSSNGEGSAYVLPGTGIMLNNMLGEQDLNPGGFHRWPENRRLASMMCPTIASLPDGGQLALGSGGSNRIRSAVLQALVNLLVFEQSLEASIFAPRLHLEDEWLGIEAGFPDATLDALRSAWPELQEWPDRSIFFGGVHAVRRHANGAFEAAGDPRRGGVVAQPS